MIVFCSSCEESGHVFDEEAVIARESGWTCNACVPRDTSSQGIAKEIIQTLECAQSNVRTNMHSEDIGYLKFVLSVIDIQLDDCLRRLKEFQS